jgi:hypothetical protein
VLTISDRAKFPFSSRIARIAMLFALAGLCPAQTDSQFFDYPFDQWAAAPEHTGLKWEIHLKPPELSMHERLVERVQVVVPGSELDKRRGRGELILMTRFEDSEGRQVGIGNRMDLKPVQAGVRSDELTFTVAAFVKPGDYRLSLALVDSETMEYSFSRRTLRVFPLKAEPLPQAWNSLPTVEILPPVQAPDAWFLPDVTHLLNLPLAVTSEPPRIELLVNMTPSQRSTNPGGTLRRNMSMVIPALKVLSALNAKIRPPSAEVIDVTRHRIAFETRNAAALDWHALSKLLTAGNTGTIDTKSLAGQSSMRDYFAREAARHADDSKGPRWLIVLSGPLDFDKQDEAPLIQLPPDPNRHIVYFRLASWAGFLPGAAALSAAGTDAQLAPAMRIRGPMPGIGVTLPGPPPGSPGRGRGPDPAVADDLESILKPMGARVAVITTPQAFRREVAVLMQLIAASRPIE